MSNAAAPSANTAALMAVIKALQQENEYLRLQLAKARREQFGRSSERGDLLAQLPLAFSQDMPVTASATHATAKKSPSVRPNRQDIQTQRLPEFLPREEHRLAANDTCGCPACGGTLKFLGEDVSEMLEFVPARFKVIRTIRPKLACGRCDVIVQAPAPSRPIARGLAGPALLAQAPSVTIDVRSVDLNI